MSRYTVFLSGCSIVSIWYPTPAWLTYKQAREANALVRGGEKATAVIFTRKVLGRRGRREACPIPSGSFHVFNAAQIDGLPEDLLDHSMLKCAHTEQ
jgi:antirestriction protein ArdC